jgi:hypothetical protein
MGSGPRNLGTHDGGFADPCLTRFGFFPTINALCIQQYYFQLANNQLLEADLLRMSFRAKAQYFMYCV